MHEKLSLWETRIILVILMEADSAIIGSTYHTYRRPGDTALDVIYKKIVNNVTFVLNPDTYSKRTAK